MTKKESKNNKPLIAFMIGIAIIGLGIFLFVKIGPSLQKPSSQKDDVKKVDDSLLITVGKLYDLPTGETPTIATVSDKRKLQDQAFFAKAENGDKVIIYATAKKAILYRPSTNKIMEVAPLTINSPTDIPKAPIISFSPTPLPTIEKQISVSIYNGTKTSGLAGDTEKKLTSQFANIKVSEKTNASKDYSATLVIDTNGNNKEMATKIATLLGGSVGSIPAGERTPQGEILIIMGK